MLQQQNSASSNSKVSGGAYPEAAAHTHKTVEYERNQCKQGSTTISVSTSQGSDLQCVHSSLYTQCAACAWQVVVRAWASYCAHETPKP